MFVHLSTYGMTVVSKYPNTQRHTQTHREWLPSCEFLLWNAFELNKFALPWSNFNTVKQERKKIYLLSLSLLLTHSIVPFSTRHHTNYLNDRYFFRFFYLLFMFKKILHCTNTQTRFVSYSPSIPSNQCMKYCG